MYLLTLADQTKLFLFSIGFGFLLGVLYDAFRTVRLMLSKNSKGVFLQDILYFVFAAFLSFLYLLVVNQGRLRGYILVGMLSGFFVYYFTFGNVIIEFAGVLVALFKKAAALYGRVVSSAFRSLGRVVGLISVKVKRIFIKKSKKSENKGKTHLKRRRNVLYNQRVNNREEVSKQK